MGPGLLHAHRGSAPGPRLGPGHHARRTGSLQRTKGATAERVVAKLIRALLLKLTGYQLYLREYIRQNIAPPHHPVIPA